MSTKAEYTTGEWGRVISGPYFAALYIVVADFNIAYFKELAAMTKAVTESAADTKSDLLKAIAVDLTAKGSQEEIKQNLNGLKEQKDPQEMKANILRSVVGAADVVASKSPEDSKEYRRWLYTLAEVTADASKEGGFLGIGAVRVSDKEKLGLDEMADALGIRQDS